MTRSTSEIGRGRGARALGLALSLGAALVGCDGEPIAPEHAAPVPGRVEAVASRREDPAARFCDVSFAPGEGPTLALPATAGPALPGTGDRWINVWASWCAPCVEELPLLARWERELSEDGAPVDVWFLNVDTAEGALDAFRAAHSDAPETATLTDPGGLPALVAALGLDAGATLPIHALVDAGGHVRCVRTGAVTERDRDTVRALLRHGR